LTTVGFDRGKKGFADIINVNDYYSCNSDTTLFNFGRRGVLETRGSFWYRKALGKSCSTQQDCISPLVCDEYAMKCAYSPVNPPFGDSGVNYTSLSQANRDAIGSGWKQIKYLPGTSTTWFPGNDNLLVYPGTEFLFTTGDFSRWLICDKFQAVGEFYNRTPRTITKSSISATPYTAVWFNRQDVQYYGHLDPVISLRDSEISQNEGTVMYTEDSHTAATSSIHSSGMYVFIR